MAGEHVWCGNHWLWRQGSKHAAAWNERDDARVIAVCDPQNERAELLVELYTAQRFDRWRDAVICADVDVVSVCVPACDHRDVAVAAANAGRQILCEKPMALALAQADDMIAAAQAGNVRLTDPEPLSMAAVGQVFARGKQRVKSVEEFGVDSAEIQVRFQRAPCLSIGINWGLPENTPGHSHDLIHGPLGLMFTVNPNFPDRFLGDLSNSLCVALKDGSGTELFPCEPDDDGPQACIADLIETIEKNSTSQFSGTEGRCALQLILAALQSIDENVTVELTLKPTN